MRRLLSTVKRARRSDAEQKQLEDTLEHMSNELITFNQTLGLKIERLKPSPVLRLPFQDALIGHYGHKRLHGGAISSTLDSVGGLALMWAIGERFCDESTEQVMLRFQRMGTIDLRVDFLNQGKGEFFLASAEVTRLGGRVGSTQMRFVNNDGLLIATGSAAYIVS